MESITFERVRELLDYDPSTGAFTWAAKTNAASRVVIGGRAGHVGSYGYRLIEIEGRGYQAHRLAWLHTHGKWPECEIDHINGNRDDNRIANLRDVSKSANKQNIRASRSDSKHGYLGATLTRGRWQAVINVRGKRRHLGMFDSGEEASRAYLAAKRVLHEGCTI